jgi:glycosyltransferase involved in cell wall biosynthesis
MKRKHLNKRWFGMINLAWRLALGRSQKVTVLSQYLKNRVIKFGYKKEVAIIPNGIDMIKFGVELSLDEKNKIRKDLGFLETDLVLVTTSRLVVKNGVADIIKSLNFLPTHTKLVILGDGFLKQKLISLVNEFDLNQRVVFLGYQDQSQMIKIMKASDIFIRPSLSEGFGNSFIEAMALKLPVIATPVGGIVDYLKDGETGYFCKPENPKSISEVVQRVVDDVSENHVIENAYQMVNREYNWDKIAEKMNKIFIYE